MIDLTAAPTRGSTTIEGLENFETSQAGAKTII